VDDAWRVLTWNRCGVVTGNCAEPDCARAEVPERHTKAAEAATKARIFCRMETPTSEENSNRTLRSRLLQGTVSAAAGGPVD
jgi:hypothetical protein